MSFNPLDSLIDIIAKQRAMDAPLPPSAVRAYLSSLARSGCDRVPLKVRNLGIPFTFAGFNETHVFLSHASTCMVSPFPWDALEPMHLRELEDIQTLVMAWMDSSEGVAAWEMIKSANSAAQSGLKIPVTVRWPDSKNTREGLLSLTSAALGWSSATWICAVETCEGQNAVFRYGLSRFVRAMHDGKKLSMALKPGATF